MARQFCFEINWPLIKVSCFGKLKSYILPEKKISQQGQYLRKKKLFGQATWSPLRSTPRKIKCYQDFFFFYFWPWTHSGSKWLKSAKNVFTRFKTNQQNYSISVCSDCMHFVIWNWSNCCKYILVWSVKFTRFLIGGIWLFGLTVRYHAFSHSQPLFSSNVIFCGWFLRTNEAYNPNASTRYATYW